MNQIQLFELVLHNVNQTQLSNLKFGVFFLFFLFFFFFFGQGGGM